jgi:cyclase
MRRAVMVLATLSCALPAWAQQDPDPAKVEIKVHKVADAIYMLEGAGGNIGVSVGSDGVLIVDDQFASLVPKIQAALKGITDQPVRFVLNTHYHGDHTGGNSVLGKGSTIIAHGNVRRRLQDPPELFGQKRPPAPAQALPVITFDHSLTVHINGEDIRALHFARGHTDGDSIIFFPKANVVHMGDDFVTYGLPFVDVASGGSLLGMIQNIDKAMAGVPDDVKVIPGHGPLSTKADVKAFNDMLKDCVALVRAARKQGKTAEQAKAANVLAKYEEKGKGFIKTADFIDLIYNELKGELAKTKQPTKTHH